MLVNEERIASLDALGFDWTVTEQGTKSFEQRIDDLRAYKEKHGHLRVKQSDNKSLCNFYNHMRHARNNPEKSDMTLSDKQIASLDALGFDWSERNKSFEQRIEDLRAYKEEHGHIRVKRSEDKSLYDFCNHMRRARKDPEKSSMALTDDRISSLDALGFDWKMCSDRSATSEMQVIAEGNIHTAHNSSPSCSMVNNPSKETDEEIPLMPPLPPPNNANGEKDTGGLLGVETAG